MANSPMQLLVQIAWTLPQLAVDVLALLLGFIYLQRFKRPALMAVGAGSVLLVAHIGGTIARFVILQNGSLSGSRSAINAFAIVNLVVAGISLVGYATLIFAIFIDRQPAASAYGVLPYGGPPHGGPQYGAPQPGSPGGPTFSPPPHAPTNPGSPAPPPAGGPPR